MPVDAAAVLWTTPRMHKLGNLQGEENRGVDAGNKRGTPGGTVNLDIILVGSVENECARETGASSKSAKIRLGGRWYT